MSILTKSLKKLLENIDGKIATLNQAREAAVNLAAAISPFEAAPKLRRRTVKRGARKPRRKLTIADHILKAIDAGHHTRSEIDAYMRKSRKGMGAQAVPSALQGLKRKGLVVLKGRRWKRA